MLTVVHSPCVMSTLSEVRFTTSAVDVIQPRWSGARWGIVVAGHELPVVPDKHIHHIHRRRRREAGTRAPPLKFGKNIFRAIIM